MSQSVFDGLALDSDGGVIRISYPGAIHDAARAAEAATTYGLTVRADRPDLWTVECAAGGSRCPVIMKTFFADLNRNPGPYECDISGYTAPAGEPLVSCVIIVNENALFVREQLVPSLLLNSGGHPIEIVLVYNGVPEVEPELARFTNVRSVWGAVSAAYNAGARTARGRIGSSDISRPAGCVLACPAGRLRSAGLVSLVEARFWSPIADASREIGRRRVVYLNQTGVRSAG